MVIYKYHCLYAARYNIDFALSADNIYLFDRSPLLEKSHIEWLQLNFILQKVIFTLLNESKKTESASKEKAVRNEHS